MDGRIHPSVPERSLRHNMSVYNRVPLRTPATSSGILEEANGCVGYIVSEQEPYSPVAVHNKKLACTCITVFLPQALIATIIGLRGLSIVRAGQYLQQTNMEGWV